MPGSSLRVKNVSPPSCRLVHEPISGGGCSTPTLLVDYHAANYLWGLYADLEAVHPQRTVHGCTGIAGAHRWDTMIGTREG